MNKLQNILDFAMRMEKDAQDFYAYYADKAESPAIRGLFHELESIEKEHYAILKKKFDELQMSTPPVSISWVVDDTFAAKDPHILADSSDTLPRSGTAVSDISIIRMAYLIENDFAEFYTHAAGEVKDGSASEFLSVLANWETKHKEMFQERYREMLKAQWGDITSIIFAGR